MSSVDTGTKRSLASVKKYLQTINLAKTTAELCQRSTGTPGCVPGTAHVLMGAPNIHEYGMLGKSQAQPDGGEGRSAIATGIR